MTASKLVVVTGSSGGLGVAVCRDLLHLGYRVVGVARRTPSDDDLGPLAENYAHMSFDIADTDGLATLARGLLSEHGDPYGLVNNAGLGGDGLLLTQHARDIDRILRVNLTAPITLTKYLARPMVANRDGRIINISSIVARTGYRGLSVYGASKAGLEGFTRSLARDLGPRSVTVNAVAPGFLETDMTDPLKGEVMERIRRRSALGRFAGVAEVAAAVRYLLSPEAAAVTGTVLTVDAGTTA